MKYLGIDASWKHSGFALIDHDGELLKTASIGFDMIIDSDTFEDAFKFFLLRLFQEVDQRDTHVAVEMPDIPRQGRKTPYLGRNLGFASGYYASRMRGLGCESVRLVQYDEWRRWAFGVTTDPGKKRAMNYANKRMDAAGLKLLRSSVKEDQDIADAIVIAHWLRWYHQETSHEQTTRD